jgi:S1-C subfamily serine protease
VVEVDHLFPESPASKADIKADDVLLLVNGVKPTNADAVIKQLSGLKAGDKATLHIKRGDKELDVSIVAAKRPPKSKPM